MTNPVKIAVLVSGGGSNLQELIYACKDKRIKGEIVLVVSSSQNAFALLRAERESIPTAVCEKSNFKTTLERDDAILSQLILHKTELVVCAGFLGILSGEILAKYKGRIVNIHPSLLPKYGGVGMHGINVHNAVLAAREPFTGATVHHVCEKVDAGAIIGQKKYKIKRNLTALELQQEVLKKAEHPLLVSSVRALCEKIIKQRKTQIK